MVEVTSVVFVSVLVTYSYSSLSGFEVRCAGEYDTGIRAQQTCHYQNPGEVGRLPAAGKIKKDSADITYRMYP